jgi:energy-coupling factor transport system ATP-binding protein
MIAQLSDVTYSFPGHDEPAIRDVDLAIERGEFLVVAGPSGGGKSTLLRTLNGLVPQFSGGVMAGHACVAGLDPRRTPPREMARIAGFVFQEPEAQSIAETVEDEIAFGMEQHGIPRPEMHTRLDRVLDRFQIASLRPRTLATLSGGERQRVAIAAVLALQPQLLLLDEPTSQLDGDSAAAVLATIDSVRADGDMTVLLAEHRLDRLLSAAGRLVNVEDGHVERVPAREKVA